MPKRRTALSESPPKRQAAEDEEEQPDATVGDEEEPAPRDEDRGNGPASEEDPMEMIERDGEEDGRGAGGLALGAESDEMEEEYDEEELDGASSSREPKTAGLIHRIYLENFMNHRKFTIVFNKNINFIHGENGSGKSAVLAALQICLGARAHVTHRGGSLAGLVRKGHKGNAVVRVTLLNGGADAYAPEKYGGKITIERVFGPGVSKYRILDEHDRPVSTQKKELELVLDRLNIQVENPCAILDQENAKEFIKGKDEDRYRFFAKATDLERVFNSIDETRTQLEEMQLMGQNSHTALASFAKEKEQTMKDYQDLQEILKIDDEITKWKVKYVWSAVEEVQEQLSGKEAEVRKLETKVTKREREHEQARQCADDGASDELKTKIVSLKADVHAAKQQTHQINNSIADAKRPFNKANQKVERLKHELKSTHQEILTLEAQINEARAVSLDEAEAEERARLEEMEQIKANLEMNKTDGSEVHNKMQALDSDTHQMDQDLRDLRHKVNVSEQEAQALHNQIGMLQRSEQAPLLQFGQRLPDVLKRIRSKAREFEQAPVGPIGVHVRLNDGMQAWSVAVEACIGPSLRSFVVCSHRDRATLQHILRECYAEEHKIVVMNFSRRYDTSANSPASGLLTIAQAIQVDNDAAFNALVELHSVEKCALFKTVAEAESECLLGRSGQLQMRQNVTRAYEAGGGFSAARNGNKFHRPFGRNARGGIKFGMDVEAQIANLQTDIQAVLAETDQLRQSGHAIEARRAEIQREYKQLHNQLKALNQTKRQLDGRARVLQQEMEEATSTNLDTTEWEADLAAHKAEKQRFEDAMAEAQQEKKERHKKVQELTEEKRKYEATNQRLSDEMDEAVSTLESVVRERQQHKARERQCAERLEQTRLMLTHAEKEKNEVERNHAAIYEQAETMTRRELGDDAQVPVKVGKDQRYVQSKILALEQRKNNGLSAFPEGSRDVDQMREAALAADKIYSQKLQEVQQVQENIVALSDDLEKRKNKWMRFRKTIARLTNNKFDETLNQKGHCGEVCFDYNARTLSVVVQKDNRDVNSQITDPKLLSGGERSYVTLSLLISLGECIECPFRVMDEFDVFMDAVSRKKALETLIETGKHYSNRQFIFITPQDISTVTPGPMVKIHKMIPPSRLTQQATLG